MAFTLKLQGSSQSCGSFKILASSPSSFSLAVRDSSWFLLPGGAVTALLQSRRSAEQQAEVADSRREGRRKVWGGRLALHISCAALPGGWHAPSCPRRCCRSWKGFSAGAVAAGGTCRPGVEHVGVGARPGGAGRAREAPLWLSPWPRVFARSCSGARVPGRSSSVLFI